LGTINVYTASTKQYADPIIDEIDPKGIIKGRFYREVLFVNLQIFLIAL
jgi:TFIIF-interacting CTD phosphatase-like protein